MVYYKNSRGAAGGATARKEDMERHSLRIARRGFTLVELIVVIGIIGILAGVLLTSFSGGTESARAAKCLANMRNLAQGAIGYAAAHDRYPYASSYAFQDISSSGSGYFRERVGWISWLSIGDEYHTRSGGGHVKDFQPLDNISACCDNDDDAAFAITNGALWKYVGQNRETYVCPSHAIRASKLHGVKVRFSYAMSAYFGYDWTKGSKAAAISGSEDWISMNAGRLDRKLLFAELPFAIPDANDGKNKVPDDDAYSTRNNTYLADCTLQYRASVKHYKTYHSNWRGTSEAIAFNHKSGKRYCAHVAFADGHVEKMLLRDPPTSGGIDSVMLTTALAEGIDVSFDGRMYDIINPNGN